jgi:hypothetical protein
MLFTPLLPSAGPTGGEGDACPAPTMSLTIWSFAIAFRAMVNVYACFKMHWLAEKVSEVFGAGIFRVNVARDLAPPCDLGSVQVSSERIKTLFRFSWHALRTIDDMMLSLAARDTVLWPIPCSSAIDASWFRHHASPVPTLPRPTTLFPKPPLEPSLNNNCTTSVTIAHLPIS